MRFCRDLVIRSRTDATDWTFQADTSERLDVSSRFALYRIVRVEVRRSPQPCNLDAVAIFGHPMGEFRFLGSGRGRQAVTQ